MWKRGDGLVNTAEQDDRSRSIDDNNNEVLAVDFLLLILSCYAVGILVYGVVAYCYFRFSLNLFYFFITIFLMPVSMLLLSLFNLKIRSYLFFNKKYIFSVYIIFIIVNLFHLADGAPSVGVSLCSMFFGLWYLCCFYMKLIAFSFVAVLLAVAGVLVAHIDKLHVACERSMYRFIAIVFLIVTIVLASFGVQDMMRGAPGEEATSLFSDIIVEVTENNAVPRFIGIYLVWPRRNVAGNRKVFAEISDYMYEKLEDNEVITDERYCKQLGVSVQSLAKEYPQLNKIIPWLSCGDEHIDFRNENIVHETVEDWAGYVAEKIKERINRNGYRISLGILVLDNKEIIFNECSQISSIVENRLNSIISNNDFVKLAPLDEGIVKTLENLMLSPVNNKHYDPNTLPKKGVAKYINSVLIIKFYFADDEKYRTQVDTYSIEDKLYISQLSFFTYLKKDGLRRVGSEEVIAGPAPLSSYDCELVTWCDWKKYYSERDMKESKCQFVYDFTVNEAVSYVDYRNNNASLYRIPTKSELNDQGLMNCLQDKVGDHINEIRHVLAKFDVCSPGHCFFRYSLRMPQDNAPFNNGERYTDSILILIKEEKYYSMNY